MLSPKDDLAGRLAHHVYDALGYRVGSTTFTEMALQMGLKAGDASRLSAHYYFEEALVYRFWAREAEARAGLVSYLMKMAERELRLPVTGLGLTNLDVLRGMTGMILLRAIERAAAAGISPPLGEDQA